MKPLFSLLLLITIPNLAADVKLGWVNGDNPGATTAWQTIIYYSLSPSVGPTNNIGSVTNSWPANTVTVTGLQAGRKYYFAVLHTDLEDLSQLSNEVLGKTKINKPQSLMVIP